MKISLKLRSFFNQKSKPFLNSDLNLNYNLLFCEDFNLHKTSLTNQQRVKLDKALKLTDAILESKINTQALNLDSKSLFMLCKLFNLKIKELFVFGTVIQTTLKNETQVIGLFNDGKYTFIDSTKKLEGHFCSTFFEKQTEKLFLLCKKEVSDKPNWEGTSACPPIEGDIKITILTSKGRYGCYGKLNEFHKDEFGGKFLNLFNSVLKEVKNY